MVKMHLVTQETMEKYYKDKSKIDSKTIEMCRSSGMQIESIDGSMGDDLESFFMNLQIGKFKPGSLTFYLPKILPCERKMIEERNQLHCSTYFSYWAGHSGTGIETVLRQMKKVDVSKVEMDLSESNSKFILCYCYRRTVRVSGKSYECECKCKII